MRSHFIYSMGRFLIVIGIMTLSLFLGRAPANAQDIELPDDPLAGQKVFVKKDCVSCHSIYGKGGKTGRDLGKTLVRLGPTGILAEMWNHSPEMFKLVQETRSMPLFSEQEMADLVAYFYFLGYLDEQGDAEKGRTVLKKKRCLSCHEVGGEGRKIGPNLDKIKSYASPLSLVQLMWNHGIEMSERMSAMNIQRPSFDGSEFVDLFAYLKEMSAYESDPDTYLAPGRPKVGERLFEEKSCIRCHMIGNKGTEVGPDLTQADFHVGVSQIAGRMWSHGPRIWQKMEELEIMVPLFEENEMADLVAYLYYLNFIEQSGDVEEGKKLFVEKGCVKCHAIRANEDGRARTMDESFDLDLTRSDAVLNFIKSTTAMWNHNLKMRILMDKAGVPMPRFNAKEVRDLFSYLRTARMKRMEDDNWEIQK